MPQQYSDREFARAYAVPVERLLGPQILRAVNAPQKVVAAILQKSRNSERGRTIADSKALSERRPLTESQTDTLRNIILDPESYWNGQPKFRRLPPNPGFGFEIVASEATVHLLVDLQNPGWEFSCDDETYWGFNFAGARLVDLAKDLFPDYASRDRGSVWRRVIIRELERRAEDGAKIHAR